MKEILEVISGALFLMFTWWAGAKNRADKKKAKINWKQWAYNHLDEALWALISAGIIGYYREEFIYFLIWIGKKFPDTPIIGVFSDATEVWDFYYDAEGIILFFSGFFAVTIVKGIIELKNKFTK